MRRQNLLYLILTINIILTACSSFSSVSYSPPSKDNNNREYFEFLEWKREISDVKSSAKTYDLLGGGIIIGGTIS